MKKGLFIIFFLYCSAIIYSQTAENLSQLDFHSDLEKTSFEKLSTDKTDKFNLLFTVNANVSDSDISFYKNQLKALYTKLEGQKVRKKKLPKAVKIIFETTHSYFFKKYEDYAEMHQIFKGGTYNCVTASAIYALVLEHFDLPYEIRELPTHVYIVVDPAGTNIVLESTDPLNGIYSIDKKRVIKRMVELKMISQSEMQRNSVDDLYEKYMETEEKAVGFQELAAALYYNASIQNAEMEWYQKSLSFINKSQYLNPVTEVALLKLEIQVMLASKANIEDITTFHSLFDLLEYEEYTATVHNDLIHYLASFSEKYLVEEYHGDKYDTFYDLYRARLKDEKHADILKDVLVLHYSQMGRSLYLRQKKKESLIYLDSAYQLAPQNLKLHTFIGALVLEGLQMYNMDEGFEYLKENVEKYPFIKEQERYQQITIVGLSEMVNQAFLSNNETEGFEKLKLFEEELNTIENINAKLKSETISSVYSSIYSFYLRQMNDAEADKWLKKGLELAPDSWILKRSKKQFDEYMEGKN